MPRVPACGSCRSRWRCLRRLAGRPCSSGHDKWLPAGSYKPLPRRSAADDQRKRGQIASAAPFEFLYPIIHRYKKAEYVPTSLALCQVIDLDEIGENISAGNGGRTEEFATQWLKPHQGWAAVTHNVGCTGEPCARQIPEIITRSERMTQPNR